MTTSMSPATYHCIEKWARRITTLSPLPAIFLTAWLTPSGTWTLGVLFLTLVLYCVGYAWFVGGILWRGAHGDAPR